MYKVELGIGLEIGEIGGVARDRLGPYTLAVAGHVGPAGEHGPARRATAS